MHDNTKTFQKIENIQKLLSKTLCFSQEKKSQLEDQTLDEKAILIIRNKTDLNLLNFNGNFCSELKQLTISGINCTQIQFELCHLKYLTILNLSNNSLNILPNEIGNLCNLVTLQLSKNQLNSLPKSLRNLHQLNYLDISHNKFVEIPFVLYYGLRSLKALDLSHNEINTFNDPPACLNKLIVLCVSNNALHELPVWIFSSLCSLQILDVSENQICFNSEHVNCYGSGIFKSLQYLNMENCNFSCANIQVLSLFKNLQVLQLGNKTIPDSRGMGRNFFGNFTTNVFKSLTYIKYLYLQNVQLSTLPPDFDCLQNVTVLDLSGNLLLWLPECFCNLISLKFLYLTSNRLLFLPKNIGKLVNLQQIHLENNALYKIPEDFHNLHNLEFADFYKNKIEKVDKKIFFKKNLKGIDLGLNCLDFSLAESDVNVDEVRNVYNRLKNSFRKFFGVSDCRSDWQSTDLSGNSAAALSDPETCSTRYSIGSEECEQNSDLEETLEVCDGISERIDLEEEDWEKGLCEVEEDELFDPNEGTVRRPSLSSWSLEFQRNYCPASSHVPSLMKTYMRNFKLSLKKEIAEEGQFDSD